MVVHANGIELPLIYRAPNNPFVDRLLHARAYAGNQNTDAEGQRRAARI